MMKQSLLQSKGKTIVFIFVLLIFVGFVFMLYAQKPHQSSQTVAPASSKIISGFFDKSKLKTDAQWKKLLTPDQFHILREAGTEVPFSGKLEYETRKGTYYS